MRAFTLFATTTSLLACTAVAAPAPWGPWWESASKNQCLTLADAQYLAEGYGALISAYTPADADRLLTDNFTDISDSINTLAGYPLGGATFTSKEAFKQGQGAQPAIPFTVQSIEAVDCASLAFRWTTTFGQAQQPVQGLIIMGATKRASGDGTWQVAKVYTEFNSLKWLQDIGGSYTLPAQS